MVNFTKFYAFKEINKELTSILGIKNKKDDFEISEIEINEENKGDFIYSPNGKFIYKEIRPGVVARMILYMCDTDIQWIKRNCKEDEFKRIQKIFEKLNHVSLPSDECDNSLNREYICEHLHRYHFTYCQTLEKLFNEGLKHRYYASCRWDGTFSYSFIGKNIHLYKNKKQILYPCQHCLRNIDLDVDVGVKLCKEIIDQVLNHVPNSQFQSEHSIKSEFEHIPNIYPEDWNEISKRLKERRNYICEECERDCSNTGDELHCHHINRLKHDNSSFNLKVLCRECHQKEHPHMRQYTKNNYIGAKS